MHFLLFLLLHSTITGTGMRRNYVRLRTNHSQLPENESLLVLRRRNRRQRRITRKCSCFEEEKKTKKNKLQIIISHLNCVRAI